MTDLVKNFYGKLNLAYIQAAKYSQKKFALDNPLLYNLSRLEPVARGHSAIHIWQNFNWTQIYGNLPKECA